MPLVQPTHNHRRPLFLFNGHLETIYPALFRKVRGVSYERERITTPDDDFLDLDWSVVGGNSLVIISHGLEGDSSRAYMTGMAKAFNKVGLDALAWNYRGCSGEINRQRRFYHSGATDDLEHVVNHCLTKVKYKKIFFVGFSLGGNLTLKYLGEKGNMLDPYIKKAVVFSVPLNLHSCSLKLEEKSNYFYAKRFLNNLIKKVKEKAKLRDDLDINGIHQIKTLMVFDDQFTAPIHGFDNAIDYYQKCSAINFLDKITLPSLIINAKNDPFLSNDCYPVEKLKQHPNVFFEMPGQGGHVGFAQSDATAYWSETRAVQFILKKIFNDK